MEHNVYLYSCGKITKTWIQISTVPEMKSGLNKLFPDRCLSIAQIYYLKSIILCFEFQHNLKNLINKITLDPDKTGIYWHLLEAVTVLEM